MERMNLDLNVNAASERQLYHASKSGIKGTIKPSSRSNCDFGKGFYMGDSESDCFSFVCDEAYPNRKFYKAFLNTNTHLNEVYLDGLRWLLVVLYNRGFLDEIFESGVLVESIKSMMATADILTGTIADDNIYESVDNFYNSYLSDVGLYKVFTEIKICKQVVAVSSKACDAIRVEQVDVPDSLIEMYMQARRDRIESSRQVLRNLPVEYKRHGYLFDEYIQGNISNKSIYEIPNDWITTLRGEWL